MFSVFRLIFRRKIEVKFNVIEKGFKLELMLIDDNYKLILNYIDDVGRNFECLLSFYKGKCEEYLRDYILMVFDLNFEMGSVIGEIFNKNGKIDIMLIYDGKVVFIVECKYWIGEKGFIEIID